MSTILKPPSVGDTHSCPAWCIGHDDDRDDSLRVCLGEQVTVQDDTELRAPYKAHALSVGLGLCDEDGLTVGLAVDYVGPNEVSLGAAKAFALAILAEVEKAEACLGTIPGPRTSIEKPLPSYAQTVTRLAREYRGKLDSSEARNALLDELFTAAGAAGISVPDALDDLFDEINAEPVQNDGAQ